MDNSATPTCPECNAPMVRSLAGRRHPASVWIYWCPAMYSERRFDPTLGYHFAPGAVHEHATAHPDYANARAVRGREAA